MPAADQAPMREAIAHEGAAHERMLAGDRAGAAGDLRRAAGAYRASWAAATAGTGYGRLIGLVKCTVLAGDPAEAADAAAYVRAEVGLADSPAASYASGLAALVDGDDRAALAAAERMRPAGDAFARAGEAVAALAGHDGPAYSAAIEAIVADFAARDAHLTGVPIADTALVLDTLAARRGMSSGVISPLLPSLQA